MAADQGTCPSCGAPIEFGLGSSLAKVCEFCSATVVRSDRGLENMGKVAEIANTPSLIAIGDEGTLGGRAFQVLGQVQLDHGKGPWDEFYVSFDHGQSWGWLAFAQGRWYVTQQVPGLAIPPYHSLELEMDIPLDSAGTFRVAETKEATITSARGELPTAFPEGYLRHYADCYGVNNAFATLDYGDLSGGYTVFTGWIFDEPQLQVTQLGQRSTNKVKSKMIKCPNCGGDVPKLSGDRAQRMGCPYCGAVSDIGLQQVVAQQEALMSQPDIPIGTTGMFDNLEYICIAYLRRGTDFDGDPYEWEEYLMWNQQVGYRWLVKDPETGWSWVVPVNVADLDLTGMPHQTTWGGRSFTHRNSGYAEVHYVLGEVYWQCEVGEETDTADYINGQDVLSRESREGEVHWNYATPVPWTVIAQGFNLPLDGPGSRFAPQAGSDYSYGEGGGGGGSGGGCGTAVIWIIVIGFILLICMLGACGSCAGSGGSGYSSGSGVYYGGK